MGMIIEEITPLEYETSIGEIKSEEWICIVVKIDDIKSLISELNDAYPIPKFCKRIKKRDNSSLEVLLQPKNIDKGYSLKDKYENLIVAIPLKCPMNKVVFDEWNLNKFWPLIWHIQWEYKPLLDSQKNLIKMSLLNVGNKKSKTNCSMVLNIINEEEVF